MIDTIDTIEKLEALAAWHCLNAEHAGSTWIWDARLRTAEDLERRAAELRARHVRDHLAARGAAPRVATLQDPGHEHRNDETYRRMSWIVSTR